MFLLAACAHPVRPPDPEPATAALTGPRASCDLVVPDDQPSIQAAIDFAQDGDLVCVRAGTWTEAIDLGGKSIALYGRAGPGQTVIDATGLGTSVVRVDGAAEATLAGFTLTGGATFYGAGLSVQDASIHVHDVWVTSNDGGGEGGGIYIEGGAARLERVRVHDNDSTYGGNDGFSEGCCGGVSLNATQAVLDNVWIAENTTAGRGPGLVIEGSEVRATHLGVMGNLSSQCAGAVYVHASAVTLDGFVLRDNEGRSLCEGGGGGLQALESTVVLAHGLLAGNVVEPYQAPGVGGGILLEDGSLDATAVVITGNVADWAGGVFAVGSVALRHGDIWGNEPQDLWGFDDPNGVDGNLSVAPMLADTLGHLAAGSPLIDAGPADEVDPDGSRADIGPFGGAEAGGWDLDGDGFFAAPSARDADCDDLDEAVGGGC